MDGNELLVSNLSGFYIFSSICVFETVYGFLELSAGWGNTSNHSCLAVSTETILQETSKLAISVRYKKSLLVFVSQGVNDIC